jgi:hypothetical protein
MTLKHLSKVLDTLQTDDVRFLIVGGLAVIAHGHTRLTHDLDLVVAMDSKNTHRVVRALSQLGFSPRIPVPPESFCDPEIRNTWIVKKGMQVFSLVNEKMGGIVIDLFAEEPFDFEKEYGRAVFIELPGIAKSLPFVCKETLLEMKKTAGRHIDLDDIYHLHNIQ